MAAKTDTKPIAPTTKVVVSATNVVSAPTAEARSWLAMFQQRCAELQNLLPQLIAIGAGDLTNYKALAGLLAKLN